MNFDPLPASLADKPTCEAVEPAMSSPGTPNRPKSMALTPKMEQLRSTSPADYPCFKETGFYKPTDGCQQRCCIIPSKTPDGEDTPKWSAMVAARMEDEDPVPQPIFDSQQSPKPSSKRPRTPSSYASSSFSPSEVPEEVAFFGRKRTRIIYGQNPANYTPGGSRKPKN